MPRCSHLLLLKLLDLRLRHRRELQLGHSTRNSEQLFPVRDSARLRDFEACLGDGFGLVDVRKEWPSLTLCNSSSAPSSESPSAIPINASPSSSACLPTSTPSSPSLCFWPSATRLLFMPAPAAAAAPQKTLPLRPHQQPSPHRHRCIRSTAIRAHPPLSNSIFVVQCSLRLKHLRDLDEHFVPLRIIIFTGTGNRGAVTNSSSSPPAFG